MRKNNKLIKNFLTTASTIAVIIGGVESTFATERVTAGGQNINATIGVNNGLNPFDDDDSIRITSKNTTLTASGAHIINQIKLNGKNGTKFSIGAFDVTVKGVTNTTAAAMPVTMTTGSLTLDGGNAYSKLGKVDGGTLNINNEGIVLSAKIGDTTALTAINIGTNANNEIEGLDGEVTFDKLVKATTINVGGKGGNGSVGGDGAKGGDGRATFTLGVEDVNTLNIGGDGGDGDAMNGKKGGDGGDGEVSFGKLDGITTINIGGKKGAVDFGNQGGKGGKGKLTLDAKDDDTDLMDGVQTINFQNAESWLELTNSSTTDDRVITLIGKLAPGNGDDLQGNLEVNSNGDKELTINAVTYETIGTDNEHRLDTLKVSGDKLATINPKIFARKIIITNTEGVVFGGEIDLGEGNHNDISSDSFSHMDVQNNIANSIKFKKDTKLESINPNDKTFTMLVAGGKTLTVDYIGEEKNNAELALENGAKLKANLNDDDILVYLKGIALEKDANLAGGTYNVNDISAFDEYGVITLGDGFTLTGGINTTHGAAANFNFEGNGTIHGDIGSHAAVGTITVANDGGELWLDSSIINATNIKGFAGNEKLKFINTDETTVKSKIGDGTKFASIEFSDANVKFDTNTIKTDEFKFTKNSEYGGTTVETDKVDFADIKITSTITGDESEEVVVRNNTLYVGGMDVEFGKDVGTMGLLRAKKSFRF